LRYIKQNLKEFDLSGILRWHEAGYTGKSAQGDMSRFRVLV